MKQFFFACAAFLFVFLTGSGCKKASVTEQPALPVNVVTVVEKEVDERDEFTGRLDPVESVEIRPRVSGYTTEIHFEAGAIVKKGTLLYVIDPRPYQADFDRATAEVERMDAQLKLAEIELNRAKELRAKATISASEFDQKAATYQGAAAAKSSAEAAKNAAALNLEFTQIKSPIDGRVSDQRITVGNLVQPGAGPDSFITPGFFVRVRVSGATPYRAALVPDRVISSQQGLKYVFVVKPDNTVERRNLETGALFEGKRIVKSGLNDGEKVVSTRLQLLQAEMKVTPVPEETPASGTEIKKSVAESQNEK